MRIDISRVIEWFDHGYLDVKNEVRFIEVIERCGQVNVR